jgi:hypothetical protein
LVFARRYLFASITSTLGLFLFERLEVAAEAAMPNDLFRMVSLRHSKASQRNGRAASRRDPRLRYRQLLEKQAKTAASSSPRESKLQELKNRHAELSKKLIQIETVQRGVISAFMSEWQKENAPILRPTQRAASSHNSNNPTPLTLEAANRALTVITDGRVFVKRVEKRLTEADTALFQTVINKAPPAMLGNLEDLLTLFDVQVFVHDANRLCMQIQTIEENLGEALPTVPTQPISDADPIVAAVGWGELVVARESLVGYDAHEIAHIENILPGETKLREHQRLSKTEEVSETETITEKETEKDSQTTDRYELQAQSQETINRDFSISTGVNTSGQYGLTQVDTSLDASFSQSQSQSRSSSINTAKEVVNKAVERTFERVRKLRRLTITEEIRELNRHKLSNANGSGSPKSISGIYLWVEKIQKVELRHYGTRMMVEFHIPEPALSLHERAAVRNVRQKLPPFNVSPALIEPTNYMCLAQRYDALDVAPPPPQFIGVGWGWTSTTNEDAEAWAEDQFASTINIPAGYRPLWGKVAWSALRGKNENREFNFAFSLGGKSEGIEHTAFPTYDGVILQFSGKADWPQGMPVSGRVHGAWDGAMYVEATITCERTPEAFDAWRLRTWGALRAGYEALERKAAQEEQREAYQRNLLGPSITDEPSAKNRRIERTELQKWAIKSMRLVPQNFNAVEQVGEFQEVSPRYADVQAPIVRLYEDAFEWEHMNYFFYPYHWARRASWRMRNTVEAIDAQHEAFLQAGAARVIVPVTPGYEDKVAWFLDPLNDEMDELNRILTPPPTSTPSSTTDVFKNLWIELLTDQKPDLARGSGTLKVKKASSEVKINSDSQWSVSDPRDLGRELYIAGNRYEIVAVSNKNTFDLDRDFEGESDESATYVAGSTPFGPPWTVNVPTSLIVLAENVPALKAV